jgi:outer membrane PBP1 activator LpoA protein
VVIGQLRSQTAGTNAVLDGLTGRLSIDVEGRIHRDLDWALIRDGKPVRLAVTNNSR